MELIQDPAVEKLFKGYTSDISKKLKVLRQHIIRTAEEEGHERLRETVKWGEPSYISKQGSTIRLGTVKNNPSQYAMYFICTTGLVATFRIAYEDELTFDANRAILFNLSDEIPTKPLKACIALALKYHKVKNLPMLGL